MANNKILTVFQTLDKAVTGNWDTHNNSYDMSSYKKDAVVYKATDKADYLKTKLELQQQSFLNNMWKKANVDLTVQAFNGLNNIKLMYRDAELMDAFPEIGAALDIVAEESCVLSDKGKVINVYSKSDRIKSVLEDLFTNRLNIEIMAQMVIRGMCKYGNQFMLLNIDNKNGVMGWKQLPVYNVERIENGIENPYSIQGLVNGRNNDGKENDMSTKFMWVDAQNSSQIPFRNWQVGHFRLISNSLYLPYGVSYLNSARRHWRMLSLMEDMMLIYRLERSIERRVYKIFVGAIDDADVKAYVEDIANNFKRTPIIDPETGQVDLRKNLLDVSQDLFIPVRDPNAPTPIDTLSAAQNLTAMDDIKFVQNKVLTALRIPRTFLNFDEAAGEGQNLALMDVRFTRTVNRIQQAFLMEMTKIASIHLYILGFDDELTNFSLTMNNPSTQAESLQIETVQKKISAIRDAVADPGNGIPIMSQTRALKEIMKWSDKEILENLEEIRLEKALASELEKTNQIIKKTRIFDNVDRIYGEPGAEYSDGQDQAQGDDGMGGGPMGGGGGGLPPMDDGGGLPSDGMDDLGMGDETAEGDIQGAEGEIPMGGAEDVGGGEEPPMESLRNKKPLITEAINKMISKNSYESFTKRNEVVSQRAKIYDDSILINEEIDHMMKSLDDFLKD